MAISDSDFIVLINIEIVVVNAAGHCHLENYKEMVDQQKIKSHLLTKVNKN